MASSAKKKNMTPKVYKQLESSPSVTVSVLKLMMRPASLYEKTRSVVEQNFLDIEALLRFGQPKMVVRRTSGLQDFSLILTLSRMQ